MLPAVVGPGRDPAAEVAGAHHLAPVADEGGARVVELAHAVEGQLYLVEPRFLV